MFIWAVPKTAGLLKSWELNCKDQRNRQLDFSHDAPSLQGIKENLPKIDAGAKKIPRRAFRAAGGETAVPLCRSSLLPKASRRGSV